MTAPGLLRYLIAYDVRDARRLRRLHQYLRGEALALQESVFLWEGPAQTLAILQSDIRRLINAREDDVRGWRLAGREPMVQCWGRHPVLPGVFLTGQVAVPVHPITGPPP